MKVIKVFSVLLLGLLASTVWADIAIIVNPDNANSISSKQVRKFYLGKSKAFPDGVKVKTFEFNTGSSDRDAFLSAVVHKDETNYSSHWARMLFSSKAKPPVKVKDASEMLSKVASTPGAIGYIDASKVDGSVKVLLTVN